MAVKRWDNMHCPYSKTIQALDISNKRQNDNGVEPCRNRKYTPRSIIHHVKTKSKCIYHFDIHHYLTSLYCDYDEKLRKCVSNDVVIPYPHDQYVE